MRKEPAHIGLIGYGSLMSGTGLDRLRVLHAERVQLRNARRGFAKYSLHGDHFAMALEPIDASVPIEGRVLGGDDAGAYPEALLFKVSPVQLHGVSQREGYDPDKLSQLDDEAAARDLSLAEFLWALLSEEGFDVARYRRRLFALTSYTSQHYVPHPVPLGQRGCAITFLAPGIEGSGSPDVVPIRVRTGNPPLMSAVEVWRERSNGSQLRYLTTCFLGALHGICLHDLICGLNDDDELYRHLRPALGRERDAEQRRFLAATGLGEETYRSVFGDRSRLPRRSGLNHLFDDKDSGA
jgi:hypothetical protein